LLEFLASSDLRAARHLLLHRAEHMAARAAVEWLLVPLERHLAMNFLLRKSLARIGLVFALPRTVQYDSAELACRQEMPPTNPSRARRRRIGHPRQARFEAGGVTAQRARGAATHPLQASSIERYARVSESRVGRTPAGQKCPGRWVPCARPDMPENYGTK
jgi:hypothetical protein